MPGTFVKPCFEINVYGPSNWGIGRFVLLPCIGSWFVAEFGPFLPCTACLPGAAARCFRADISASRLFSRINLGAILLAALLISTAAQPCHQPHLQDSGFIEQPVAIESAPGLQETLSLYVNPPVEAHASAASSLPESR